MFPQNPRIGQELLDVPMGKMIRDMAFAIADAQMRLDENSIEVAEMMGGLQTIKETINGKEVITFSDSRVFFGKEKVSLSEAVGIYNQSSDSSLKAIIIGKLGANFARLYDKPVVDVTTVPEVNSTDIFTPNQPKDENVYYRYTVTGNEEFFIWDDSNQIYTKLDISPSPKEQIALKPDCEDSTIFIPQRLSMLELGFSPTFYQFVDTIIEVKISIKYSRSADKSMSVGITQTNRRGKVKFGFGRGISTSSVVTTTQVNASYSQKYSYSAEGSSLMRTKLVPIPPPAILEKRIEQQMEIAMKETDASSND